MGISALQQALEHLLDLVRRGGLDQIMQRAHLVPRKRELHAHADEDELHRLVQRPRLARQVDAQPVADIIVEKDQLVFFRLEGAQETFAGGKRVDGDGQPVFFGIRGEDACELEHILFFVLHDGDSHGIHLLSVL